jgi:hypothetical protein
MGIITIILGLLTGEHCQEVTEQPTVPSPIPRLRGPRTTNEEASDDRV